MCCHAGMCCFLSSKSQTGSSLAAAAGARSPCPPGFSFCMMTDSTRCGSNSFPSSVSSSCGCACINRGMNRSRSRPLWPKRLMESKANPATGLPSCMTSVINANSETVCPAKLTTEFLILACSGVARSRNSTVRMGGLSANHAQSAFQLPHPGHDILRGNHQWGIKVHAQECAIAGNAGQQSVIVGDVAHAPDHGVGIGSIRYIDDHAGQQSNDGKISHPGHCILQALQFTPQNGFHA